MLAACTKKASLKALGLLLAALALLPSAPLRADELSEGLKAYRALDYDAATPLLERAAEDAHLTPTQRASAALHLGVIHFALGAEDSARARFRQALVLDPALTLPRDVSPKVRELLEQERVNVVRVVAPAAPPAAAPSQASSSAEPEAVDANKKTLRQKSNEATPKNVAATPSPPATATPEEHSVWQSPWLWAGLGAAVIVAGGATIAALWWLSQQDGKTPPGTSATCDAPSGSGCVRVTF